MNAWEDMIYKARYRQKLTERVLGEGLLGVIRDAKRAGLLDIDITRALDAADRSVGKHWRNDRHDAEFMGCTGDIGGAKQNDLNAPEAVDHPEHYVQSEAECIECIKSATKHLEGAEAFYAGTAIKYLFQHSLKGGINDLEKAKWNIDRLIDEYNGHDRTVWGKDTPRK